MPIFMISEIPQRGIREVAPVYGIERTDILAVMTNDEHRPATTCCSRCVDRWDLLTLEQRDALPGW